MSLRRSKDNQVVPLSQEFSKGAHQARTANRSPGKGFFPWVTFQMNFLNAHSAYLSVEKKRGEQAKGHFSFHSPEHLEHSSDSKLCCLSAKARDIQTWSPNQVLWADSLRIDQRKRINAIMFSHCLP